MSFVFPRWLVLGLCVSLACGAGAHLRAAEWPEFRGPTKQGHSAAKRIPIEWSESKNIAWKTPLVGQGWSSPVVSGQQIIFTAAVPMAEDKPNDFDLCTEAYDLKTGQQLWRTKIFQQEGSTAPKIHGKNSHASPTPIIEGDKLFVHFGHMGTACLDLKGQIVWKNDELKFDPVHGNGGSPILVGDKLIFSCDGAAEPVAVALDKNTGKLAWKTRRPNEPPKTFAFCTPLAIEVAGKTQVIFPCAGSVCAYDPATGEEIWHVDHNGYSVIPRPVFGNGMVYVCTSYDSPTVMAIRPDGTGNVTDTHVEWVVKKGAPHTPSMILDGAELYMVSDNGVATCVDALTGKQVWQQRLGGNFSSSLVLAEGRLYCQDENGTCYVLATGREFQKIAENSLPERTLASYALLDGRILLRGDKHLYCVEQQ